MIRIEGEDIRSTISIAVEQDANDAARRGVHHRGALQTVMWTVMTVSLLRIRGAVVCLNSGYMFRQAEARASWYQAADPGVLAKASLGQGKTSGHGVPCTPVTPAPTVATCHAGEGLGPRHARPAATRVPGPLSKLAVTPLLGVLTGLPAPFRPVPAALSSGDDHDYGDEM